MSEAGPETVKAPDLVQARWPLWIAGICLLAGAVALLSGASANANGVYAIATAWTCWAIRAYAKGKRFHVAPGLYAAAEDTQKHRRVMLGICLCMFLGFTALIISRAFGLTS